MGSDLMHKTRKILKIKHIFVSVRKVNLEKKSWTSNKKAEAYYLDLSRLADLFLGIFFKFSDTWHFVLNLENQNENDIILARDNL